jgi:thioredoxin reductase
MDIIIIGSGPAGLQSAYFCKKFNLKYVVLESSSNVSNFFRTKPRHRNLISINKPYNIVPKEETNLRFDWNSLLSDEMKPKFCNYSSDYFPSANVLVQYIEDFYKYHELNVILNAPVIKVSKENDEFVVQTGNKEHEFFKAKIVIAAHGLSKFYIPKIEGIEHALNYGDFELDVEKFKKKRVYIIGKGNSGFETAKWLMSVTDITYISSPSDLRLAVDTHYVGSLRAVNNLSLEAYQLKSNNIIINGTTNYIRKKGDGYTVGVSYHCENIDIDVDYIINATGFQMDTSFYDTDLKPRMRCCNKLPLSDSTFQSINVPNLHFAGMLMHASDYRKGTSGFIHGFRHNIFFLIRYLNQKINNNKIECDEVSTCPEKLSYLLLDRGSYSAALFLQIKTIADAVLIKKDGKGYHYKDMNRNYLISDHFSEEGDTVLTMYLDYGKFFTDSYKQPRPVEAVDGPFSAYLHPYFNLSIKNLLISVNFS